MKIIVCSERCLCTSWQAWNSIKKESMLPLISLESMSGQDVHCCSPGPTHAQWTASQPCHILVYLSVLPLFFGYHMETQHQSFWQMKMNPECKLWAGIPRKQPTGCFDLSWGRLVALEFWGWSSWSFGGTLAAVVALELFTGHNAVGLLHDCSPADSPIRGLWVLGPRFWQKRTEVSCVFHFQGTKRRCPTWCMPTRVMLPCWPKGLAAVWRSPWLLCTEENACWSVLL